MTTYREGQGYRIKSVTSDPDNSKVGQVWYNSTELKLKGKLTVAAAWSSGGNLNSARHALTGFGTQTAGLAAGGQTTANNEVPAQMRRWNKAGGETLQGLIRRREAESLLFQNEQWHEV